MEMAKIEVKVDYEKAARLAKAIVSAKVHNPARFNRSDIFPDAIVPEGVKEGSEEHALFLFHSVSIDSMRQSEHVYRAMRDVAGKIGSLRKLSDFERKDLERILVPYFGWKIKYPRAAMSDPVGTLFYNAKKLEMEYEGNPGLLKGKSVNETLKNITEFRQFGIPKSALLMKNYVRTGIWDFSEYEIPIKVDRHVLRVSLGCGVVDLKDHVKNINGSGALPKGLAEAKEALIAQGLYSEEDFHLGRVGIVRADKFVLPLTETYLEVTRRERISAVELDDSWWATGRYACGLNDLIYCEACCPVKCGARPPSDNNANWFFPYVDKRANVQNLFTASKK